MLFIYGRLWLTFTFNNQLYIEMNRKFLNSDLSKSAKQWMKREKKWIIYKLRTYTTIYPGRIPAICTLINRKVDITHA